MFGIKPKEMNIVKVKDDESEKQLVLSTIENLKKLTVFDKAAFTDDMPAEAILANLLFANLVQLQLVNSNLEMLLSKK